MGPAPKHHEPSIVIRTKWDRYHNQPVDKSKETTEPTPMIEEEKQ